MLLPHPTGAVSAALIRAMRADDPSAAPTPSDVPRPADPMTDADTQLALWIGYELHYRGFDDVAPTWEWEPRLIALRRALEANVLSALRRDVEVPTHRPVPEALAKLVDSDTGPSLSRYIQREASRDQVLDYIKQRSTYQLKEADPHTWAIPRLRGRAKSALVEIQADEYGAGSVTQMHSELFAQTMRSLGLDDSYGAYVGDAAPITLAVSNVMSLFALRRDLRGAIVGHLAAYEMTSSLPCRRYAAGLRRLGEDDIACAFYDVHVMADALHEQLAAYDLCGSLADDEPELADDILFGAAACLYIEGRFGAHLLSLWAVVA
ncbi:MAG TPA: iron-containing redox enzyme family protein [Jatrophihabitantaceae bacterium]|jgi:hypothetical protein|nr:iron-containing redox enzyme family protein [Jatrophihabitantaceae bacterium]